MYPLAFPLTQPLVREASSLKSVSTDLESIGKTWQKPLFLKGNFLCTRSKALSIEAVGLVHLKESVIFGSIVCKGTTTGWYSQVKIIDTESSVSLIGCGVENVMAKGGISCKESTVGTLKGGVLRLEKSVVYGNISCMGLSTIFSSQVTGCITYMGSEIYVSNSLIRSIICQKPVNLALKSQVVYLHNCRVLGSISFESGQGKVIATGSTPKLRCVSPKIWV